MLILPPQQEHPPPGLRESLTPSPIHAHNNNAGESCCPSGSPTGSMGSSGGAPEQTRPGSQGSGQQRQRKTYVCDECPAGFGSKMELEEHQNSHTGKKPFECDVCNARFNRRSTLWNHKRIHSDHKPFTCPVCQLKFKWKNSLKCHKEMHLRKNETGPIDPSVLRQDLGTPAKRGRTKNYTPRRGSKKAAAAAAAAGNGSMANSPASNGTSTPDNNMQDPAMANGHFGGLLGHMGGTAAEHLMAGAEGLSHNSFVYASQQMQHQQPIKNGGGPIHYVSQQGHNNSNGNNNSILQQALSASVVNPAHNGLHHPGGHIMNAPQQQHYPPGHGYQLNGGLNNMSNNKTPSSTSCGGPAPATPVTIYGGGQQATVGHFTLQYLGSGHNSSSQQQQQPTHTTRQSIIQAAPGPHGGSTNYYSQASPAGNNPVQVSLALSTTYDPFQAPQQLSQDQHQQQQQQVPASQDSYMPNADVMHYGSYETHPGRPQIIENGYMVRELQHYEW